MADQPKKPRNVKDLKARLGKTITPGQQGQGQQQQGGGAVPPPNVGQGQSGGGGSVPPPAVPGGGGGAPGGVTPPPFMQQGGQQQQQPQQQQRSSDPFAGGQAQAGEQQQQREVRLVVDESAVEDSEVGRRARRVTMYVGLAAAVLGIAVGTAVGSTVANNQTYNQVVRDGKTIYQNVRDASGKVETAKGLVDDIAKDASGSPTEPPKVNYEAITKLADMEKPFKAEDFARMQYGAFNQKTVDALFKYANKVSLMWSKIGSLASSTLPKSRREVLDKAAKAAEEQEGTKVGCVPATVEKQFVCGLVYIHGPKEGEKGKVMVSSSKSGRTVSKKVYQGDADLSGSPEDYVIVAHPKRSKGVLGEQTSVFTEFRREVSDLQKLASGTLKVQGRLESGVGSVATLEERFAF